MINKEQYEQGIRCKGMCNFGSGFMNKCKDIGYCYQYKINNIKHKVFSNYNTEKEEACFNKD